MTGLRGSRFAGAALTHRSGHRLEGNHPLGFRLALHRKDLASGHGDEDVSTLDRWFRAAGDPPPNQYQP